MKATTWNRQRGGRRVAYLSVLLDQAAEVAREFLLPDRQQGVLERSVGWQDGDLPEVVGPDSRAVSVLVQSLLRDPDLLRHLLSEAYRDSGYFAADDAITGRSGSGSARSRAGPDPVAGSRPVPQPPVIGSGTARSRP